MRIIQLKTTQKHTDLDQFVRTLYRTDSNFEYGPVVDGQIEISLIPKFWSLVGSYKSPSVIFVRGIVDQKCLNTLNPIIEVRPTFMYKGIQLGILILPCIFILIAAVRLQSLSVLPFLACVSVGLLFFYLMYKSGEYVFSELLHYELSMPQNLSPKEHPSRLTDQLIIEEIRRKRVNAK